LLDCHVIQVTEISCVICFTFQMSHNENCVFSLYFMEFPQANTKLYSVLNSEIVSHNICSQSS